VTISYVAPTLPPPDRSKALERYGFECDCKLCRFEKKEIAFNKQKMALYSNTKTSEYAQPSELDDRIAKINELRANGGGDKLNLCIANLLYDLVAKLGDRYFKVRFKI